ncbi:Por secretion system C-terminal sorting domain-containing protein [Flexibacter flexilis DSM 6793]|uniref:Por secretion system C-terminal sorting domain-containing protein n=1 Tax=Flexibacter flexilis DSM 6793 TaxID=927664 RepID=A0A1I1NE87_9BACT|nr:T9SS type A sorting domain-containing protein [Flexibacter flexilis]SFC95805.1 Por secretion system C-terminal sorting domain-containing protein [Flexibacter flexilis DSM 6793]
MNYKLLCGLFSLLFLAQTAQSQSISIQNLNTKQSYQASEKVVICPNQALSLQCLSSETFYSPHWQIKGLTAQQFELRKDAGGNTLLTFANIASEKNYIAISIVFSAQKATGQSVTISRKCIVLGECAVKEALVLGSPDTSNTVYWNAFPKNENQKYWVAGNLELRSTDSIQPRFDIIGQQLYFNPFRISVGTNGKPIRLNIKQSIFGATASRQAWDGLFLSGKTQLRIHESLFADSREGIVCNNYGKDTASQITKCVFANNNTSVQVLNAPALITHTDFVARPSQMPRIAQNSPKTQYAHCFVRSTQPFVGFYQNTFDGAMYGLDLQNTYGQVRIGEPNKGGNIFKNIFVAGIYSSNPDYGLAANTLQLYECQFFYAPDSRSTQIQKAKQDRQIDSAASYGLYCQGNTQIDWAGAGHNLFQSPNADCHEQEHIGVYAEGCPQVNIDELNQFVHLSTAVQLWGDGQRYTLSTNTFIECKTGIHLRRSSKDFLIFRFGCNAFVKNWETPYRYTAALLEGNSPIVRNMHGSINELGGCSFGFSNSGDSPLGNLVLTDVRETKLPLDKRNAPNDFIFINNQRKYLNDIMPLTYNTLAIEPLRTQQIPSINTDIILCTSVLYHEDAMCFGHTAFAAPSHPTTLQNSPNPATSSTLMSYELSESLTPEALAQNPVRLQIRDVTGKLWYEQSLSESNGSLELNTAHWPSGIYLGSLQHNGKVLAKHKIAIQQ